MAGGDDWTQAPAGRARKGAGKGKAKNVSFDDRGDRDNIVLAGPKVPHWACQGCGHVSNWASRLRCQQCDRAATLSTAKKAQAAHVAALKRPKPGEPPKPQGVWAGGWQKAAGEWVAKPDHRDKEIARLRKLVETHKEDAAATSTPDTPGQEGEPEAAIGDLVALLDSMEKVVGAESPATMALREQIAHARERRDAAKTPEAVVRAAKKLHDKKKRAVDAADSVSAKAAAAAADAAKEAQLAELASKAAQAELLAAEEGLRSARTSALEAEVPAPPKPGSSAGLPDDLEDKVRGDTEAEAALACLRGKFAAAAAAAAEEAKKEDLAEGLEEEEDERMFGFDDSIKFVFDNLASSCQAAGKAGGDGAADAAVGAGKAHGAEGTEDGESGQPRERSRSPRGAGGEEQRVSMSLPELQRAVAAERARSKRQAK